MEINLNGLTVEELKELAEKAKKKAELQKRIEEKGIKNADFVSQILELEETKDETHFFKVEILDSKFEYKDKELVRGIKINGVEPLPYYGNMDRKRQTFLPEDFVEDLKTLDVVKFALTGEVPVKLIAELINMGCEFQGFASEPLSDFINESGLKPLINNPLFDAYYEGTREGRELAALKKIYDSSVSSKFTKEPRLLFTTTHLSDGEDSEE